MAASAPPPGLSAEATSSALGLPCPLDFLALVGRLKVLKRTGWVVSGVALPESIADHSCRMALAGLLAADVPGLSGERCALVGLAHDVAECITTDIVPGAMPAAAKHALEAAAMATLRSMLDAGGHPRAAALLAGAYAEYEAQATPEARFVKSLDKLEMLLQAHEYEGAQPGLRLEGFFASTPLSKLPDPTVRGWAAALLRAREAAGRSGGGGGDDDGRERPAAADGGALAGWRAWLPALPDAGALASAGVCFAAGALAFALFTQHRR